MHKIEKYLLPENEKFQCTTLVIDQALTVGKHYENFTILASDYPEEKDDRQTFQDMNKKQ